jgi:hypothetical protein
MKTGYEKRHNARLQLALDLCLEISQRIEEYKSEEKEKGNYNSHIANIGTMLENLSTAAEIIGIHTLTRLEKIDGLR